MQYETGDHVAVYPCNLPELVDRLCVQIGVSPGTYFTANYVTSDGTVTDDQPPVTVPTTVHQLLSEELDLALREPFNELLTYLYSAAENPQEKHRLETWLEILRQGEDHPDAVTLSRLTDKKVYVQGLMQENAQALCQSLSHSQCHYYVCGDAKMADDVFEVFMVIAKTIGQLSHIEAAAFFEQMKQEKRFHTDVWGVQLNFKQAIHPTGAKR